MSADCVLSLQAIGEFFHATTRKRLLAPRVAARQVDDWITAFQLTTATATAMSTAVRWQVQARLGFWDGLMLATLREAGCTALLSEDLQHGADYDGVRVLNPFLGERLSDEIEALLAVE
jgi:predicted nucleic acid-binding protein